MKHTILFAAMLCVAMSATAQTESNDTLQIKPSDFVLQEVTVQSKNVIQKVDRQILLIRKILFAWSTTTNRACDTTVRRLW